MIDKYSSDYKATKKEENYAQECIPQEQEEEEEEEQEEQGKALPSDDLHLPLPLHVAMKFFAQLPIPCIAQLRLVCKSWNSLLSSSSFLFNLEQEYKAISDSGHCGDDPWFVMAASTTTTPYSHNFLAFSYPLWKPFRLPVHTSSKLGDLLLRVASSQSLVPSVVNMLVASAGGLMCAVVKGAAPLGFTQQRGAPPYFISELTYDIVVFNCLTGELKTLPRPARLANKLISSCRISMRAEAATNTYGIILCDTKYREMEIYDSWTGSWQAGVGIRASSEGDRIGGGGGILANADVSIADLLESDVIRYRKEELAVYDVRNNCWRKAEVEVPRIAATELFRSTVVKCDGGIYLVACIMKQAVRMEGYGVWELREERRGGSLKWEERGRTPADVVAELGRTKFESPAFYDCRFVGGLKSEWVCMTGVHYTVGSGTRAEYWPPLFFNVRRRQWLLLPPRPCLCLFPFQPSFTAPV